MLEYECSSAGLINEFWSVSNCLNSQIASDPVLHQGTLYVKKRSNAFERNEFFLNSKFIYYRNETNSIIRCKVKWCLLDSFFESTPEGLDYGFSIINSSGHHDFYTYTAEALELWLFHLSSICIMTGFEQDFVVIKDINQGRYGKVELCQDVTNGAEYAVKKILKDPLDKEEQLFCIRNEIKILNKVNHPNCVKLYRTYEDDSAFYLVLEYVKHGNLLERLLNVRGFTETDALEFIRNLLEVVEYLHSLGIIHRDIKLENILMCSNENNVEFKLADFGLATYIEKVHKSKCGSPGFMAPEVITGEYYSLKADIFSLGVVFYIILSGKQPFYAESLNDILEKNKRGKAKHSSKVWTTISQGTCGLVKALMNTDPNLRLTADRALMHPSFSIIKKNTISNFPTVMMVHSESKDYVKL